MPGDDHPSCRRRAGGDRHRAKNKDRQDQPTDKCQTRAPEECGQANAIGARHYPQLASLSTTIAETGRYPVDGRSERTIEGIGVISTALASQQFHLDQTHGVDAEVQHQAGQPLAKNEKAGTPVRLSVPRRDLVRGNRKIYQGTGWPKWKNPPEGPSSGNVASCALVFPPSDTSKVACGPPIAVFTQPGCAEFTLIPVPRNSCAR